MLVLLLTLMPLLTGAQSSTKKTEFTKRFTKVYNDEGVEIKAWDLDALVVAGGLRSSLNDLLIYAKNNMENKNTDLSKAVELTHQVTFSKETIVGLGWHIIQSADEAYYWHNGSTGGSRSFIMMDLNKKTAVIVLSNSNVETDTAGVRIFEKL